MNPVVTPILTFPHQEGRDKLMDTYPSKPIKGEGTLWPSSPLMGED